MKMVSSGLFFIPSSFFKNEKVDDTRARTVEDQKTKSLLTQQDQAPSALHQLPQGFPGVRQEKHFGRLAQKGPTYSTHSYTATECKVSFTDEETIKVELRNYLQIVQVDSDTDPLDWWKYLQVNFPGVAKLAKKYLFICIPATSAPSMFTNVNIITSYKSTPKPEAMDGLVFPMQNLQRLNMSFKSQSLYL